MTLLNADEGRLSKRTYSHITVVFSLYPLRIAVSTSTYTTIELQETSHDWVAQHLKAQRSDFVPISCQRS